MASLESAPAPQPPGGPASADDRGSPRGPSETRPARSEEEPGPVMSEDDIPRDDSSDD